MSRVERTDARVEVKGKDLDWEEESSAWKETVKGREYEYESIRVVMEWV